METKDKIIIMLLLVAVIGVSFGFYYEIKWSTLEYGEEGCWLRVQDSNGRGFGDVVVHCPQTKFNCENADWHDVPCRWEEEIILVDKEGNELGRSGKGCVCVID